MSGGDFEAEIRNSLSALTSKVDAFARSTNKSKTEVVDLEKHATEAFRAAARHARGAGEEVEGLGTEIRHAGHALKGIGGILGEAAHKLTAGMRLGGGMAGLAAAAVVAGTAWEVANKIMERSSEQIKERIKLTHELSKAMRDASWKEDERGLNTVSQMDQSIRLLHGRGGVAGEDQAMAIAGEGIGISTRDAMAGVSESYLINDPKIRAKAIELGKVLAQTGEMSFSEAIKAIASDQVAQTMIGQSGSMSDVGARAIVKGNGQLPTTDNLNRAMAEMSRVGALDPNGMMRPLNQVVGIQNQGTAAALGSLNVGSTTGGAVGAASRALEQQLDPVGYRQKEFQRLQNELAYRLRQQGDAQSHVLNLIQGFGHFFGGAGNPWQQADEVDEATDRAVSGAFISHD